MNEVRFIVCTSTQYKNATKDSNVLYFVIDSATGIAIYKGEVMVANNIQVATASTLGSVMLTDDIQTNASSGVSSGIAVTPKAVVDFMKNLDAMRFKGTLGTNGTITTVPTNNYEAGDVYKIITAGTYAGVPCEVGDMIIAINDGPSSGSTVIDADWVVVQGNIDGVVIGPSSATDLHVAVFDGTTGKIIKDGGHALSEFLTAHQGVEVNNVLGERDTQRNTVQINPYGVCSTAAATAAKVVSITKGTPTLNAGLRVTVNFANANTASSPTLAVNNLTASPIYFEGAAIGSGDEKFLLKGVQEFVFDGTNFHLCGNHMPVWGTLS
jgi:hypothetical protein